MLSKSNKLFAIYIEWKISFNVTYIDTFLWILLVLSLLLFYYIKAHTVCLYEIQLWKYAIPLNYKYLGNYLFESPLEKIRVAGLT